MLLLLGSGESESEGACLLLKENKPMMYNVRTFIEVKLISYLRAEMIKCLLTLFDFSKLLLLGI